MNLTLAAHIFVRTVAAICFDVDCLVSDGTDSFLGNEYLLAVSTAELVELAGT